MPARARNRPPIALLTDFGGRDHYAGVIRGVIASIAPAASVIDITHGIPPQNVTAGAIALGESWRFFPPRTIFLAVVDPGVGTARKPIAIETRASARFVGPDNGLLSLAAAEAEAKSIVELRSSRYRREHVSATFHGRDIFAPAAAWLWRGTRLDALGPRLERIEKLDFGALSERGRRLIAAVIYVDAFGNLITNVTRARLDNFAARFRGCRLTVKMKRRAPIAILKAYGDAPRGAPLAIFGSFEMLEIAVREGDAARYFDAAAGAPITIQAEN